MRSAFCQSIWIYSRLHHKVVICYIFMYLPISSFLAHPFLSSSPFVLFDLKLPYFVCNYLWTFPIQLVLVTTIVLCIILLFFSCFCLFLIPPFELLPNSSLFRHIYLYILVLNYLLLIYTRKINPFA